MGLHEILAQIDREISQLQRARAMLEAGSEEHTQEKKPHPRRAETHCRGRQTPVGDAKENSALKPPAHG